MTNHPNYTWGQAYYDVAVIFLKDSLEYKANVQPICLPEEADANRNKYQDHFVRLLGSHFDTVHGSK